MMFDSRFSSLDEVKDIVRFMASLIDFVPHKIRSDQPTLDIVATAPGRLGQYDSITDPLFWRDMIASLSDAAQRLEQMRQQFALIGREFGSAYVFLLSDASQLRSDLSVLADHLAGLLAARSWRKIPHLMASVADEKDQFPELRVEIVLRLQRIFLESTRTRKGLDRAIRAACN